MRLPRTLIGVAFLMLPEAALAQDIPAPDLKPSSVCTPPGSVRCILADLKDQPHRPSLGGTPTGGNGIVNGLEPPEFEKFDKKLDEFNLELPSRDFREGGSQQFQQGGF